MIRLPGMDRNATTFVLGLGIVAMAISTGPVARADDMREDPDLGSTILLGTGGYLGGMLFGSFLGCWVGSQVGDDQAAASACETGFIAGGILGGGFGLAGLLTAAANEGPARFGWTWLGQAIGAVAVSALFLASEGSRDLSVAIPLAIALPVAGGVAGFELSAPE